MPGLLTPEEFAQIRRHLEAAFPEEGCGVLLEKSNGAGRVVARCRNVQNDLYSQDPERYPPATHAYTVSPEDLAMIQWEIDQGGGLLAIWHSHTIGLGAHLSNGDIQATLIDGQPQSPDTLQIVGAVREGTLEDIRAFRWDRSRGCYLLVGCAVMKDGALVQPRVVPLVIQTAPPA